VSATPLTPGAELLASAERLLDVAEDAVRELPEPTADLFAGEDRRGRLRRLNSL
jgi:hypothetical protein